MPLSRKLAAGLSTLIVMVAFSGCTTTGQPSSGSGAARVIDRTREVCNFAPTTTSILAILNVPGAPAADQLVRKICEQVNRQSAVESAAVGSTISVRVDGKVVTGTKVPK